jgi:hypothetical protein
VVGGESQSNTKALHKARVAKSNAGLHRLGNTYGVSFGFAFALDLFCNATSSAAWELEVALGNNSNAYRAYHHLYLCVCSPSRSCFSPFLFLLLFVVVLLVCSTHHSR